MQCRCLIAVYKGCTGTECIMSSSRKYPYLPHGRLMEIPRGRGMAKANIFKEKHGAKLQFLEGWECACLNPKNLPWEGYGLFWSHTICFITKSKEAKPWLHVPCSFLLLQKLLIFQQNLPSSMDKSSCTKNKHQQSRVHNSKSKLEQ